MSHQTALLAALPPLYGSITFTSLEENYSTIWLNYYTYCMLKSKGKTVYEPSPVKQLSLNHGSKIGLKEIPLPIGPTTFSYIYLDGHCL
jgi:hypothetical protein